MAVRERAQTGVVRRTVARVGRVRSADDARLCLMPRQTKSKFQRHKEEQEAKKRAEEEEAVSTSLLLTLMPLAPPCLFLAGGTRAGREIQECGPPFCAAPVWSV